MEIRGLTGDIYGLMANASANGIPSNFIKNNAAATTSTMGIHGPLERAKQLSDTLNLTKQRKPLVFEYYKTHTDATPEVVELYINPERMSIATQKVKAKQITRGGIFYHHWGDDHWSMQLAGTTGLSAMRGIEQLEQVYHASGTLLRYQNFGPDKSHNFTDRANTMYRAVDYSDPVSIMQNITEANTAEQIDNTLSGMNNSTVQNSNLAAQYKIMQQVANSNKFLISIMGVNDNITKTANQLKIWKDEYLIKKGIPAPLNEYYLAALEKFRVNCPGLSSELMIYLAYQHTETEYLMSALNDLDSLKNWEELKRNLSSDNPTTYDVITSGVDSNNSDNTIATNVVGNDDVAVQANNLYINRTKALSAHLNEMDLHYRREHQRRTQLRDHLESDMKTEFKDPWKPRKVVCYFENRAYIGHFESFSYNRVATAPLITYELRFVIEKQIVGQFNMGTASNKDLFELEKAVPPTPTPPPSSSSPGSNNNYYDGPRAGDPWYAEF